MEAVDTFMLQNELNFRQGGKLSGLETNSQQPASELLNTDKLLQSEEYSDGFEISTRD